MGGRIEHLLRPALLHESACAHDGDGIRQLGGHAKIVRNQQHGHAKLPLEPRQQLQNLGLHRRVQGGSGLVCDEQFWLAGQGYGQRRALKHAARELVRIGEIAGRLQPDQLD